MIFLSIHFNTHSYFTISGFFFIFSNIWYTIVIDFSSVAESNNSFNDVLDQLISNSNSQIFSIIELSNLSVSSSVSSSSEIDISQFSNDFNNTFFQLSFNSVTLASFGYINFHGILSSSPTKKLVLKFSIVLQ
jgi:hypothetical protein